VQWDSDFADIEKTFLPSEKDLRRMTATHLKRLFAAQDGYSTLDRSVMGSTVSEGDEKEGKSVLGDEASLGSGASTPAEMDTGLLAPPSEGSAMSSASSSPSDGMTPMNVVMAPMRNPLSQPSTPDTDDTDSDSTIGAKHKPALPRPSPSYGLGIESSEMDSDYFVSRLPRRTKPAAR
jgi:1-phosphatidylinositol-3-phosphate 5-kinase